MRWTLPAVSIPAGMPKAPKVMSADGPDGHDTTEAGDHRGTGYTQRLERQRPGDPT